MTEHEHCESLLAQDQALARQLLQNANPHESVATFIDVLSVALQITRGEAFNVGRASGEETERESIAVLMEEVSDRAMLDCLCHERAAELIRAEGTVAMPSLSARVSEDNSASITNE